MLACRVSILFYKKKKGRRNYGIVSAAREIQLHNMNMVEIYHEERLVLCLIRLVLCLLPVVLSTTNIRLKQANKPSSWESPSRI